VVVVVKDPPAVVGVERAGAEVPLLGAARELTGSVILRWVTGQPPGQA
jgi:hypothetical protein